MSLPRAIILFTGCIFFFSAVTSSYSQNVTEVGAILPLTGDSAFWGENPKKAIELALEDLRIKDRINNVRFVFEDDHCNARDAVAAFHKLVDVDKVKIILGPSCSSAAAAITPLAERSRVLVVPFAESGDVKTGPYVIRLWVPNNIQGQRLAEFAFKQNLRMIAVISVQNAFGTAITQAFSNRFKSLGGKIVASEEYSPSADTFRSELVRLKAAKPEALFFASYIKDGEILVREARQMGLSVPLLGPSTINSPDFLSSTKNFANGLVFADLTDSSAASFRERWSSTFRTEYPGMQSGASLFYDLTILLGHWLQNGDPSNAADFLRSIDYLGASGRIKFTQDGNLDRQHSIFRISDGKVKPLSE